MKSNQIFVRSYIEMSGLIDFIATQGADPQVLFEDAGMAFPPYKTKTHYDSWAALCTMWELFAERVNDPYIGLKWSFAMPEDFRSSGATLYLAFVAGNMKTFLPLAQKYQQLHTNGVGYSYEADDEAGTLIGYYDFHPYSPAHRQLCEHIMSSVVIMGRRYIEGFQASHITFQHSAPKDLSWYERAFECPVEFNAARNAIIVDYKYYTISANPYLMKVFSGFFRTYLNLHMIRSKRVKMPVSVMIAQILPSLFGVNNTDMNAVATALDMHPKKLQRELTQEGTSYSDVIDDVRRNMAVWLLSNSEISIGQTAKMLDYSTDRAFGVATKRWFNMSPSAYRKSHTCKIKTPRV